MDRKVTVAKSAGFCFGVERAVDQVYEQIEALKNKKASGPIYTYGPIIHNEEVVRDLSDKGVMVLETEEELRALPRNQGTVIIRSHGVSRHVYEILKEQECGRGGCHLSLCEENPPHCGGAHARPGRRW